MRFTVTPTNRKRCKELAGNYNTQETNKNLYCILNGPRTTIHISFHLYACTIMHSTDIYDYNYIVLYCIV